MIKAFKNWQEKAHDFYQGGQFSQREIGVKRHQEICVASLKQILDSLTWHLIFIPLIILLYAFFLLGYVDTLKVTLWYLAVLLSMLPTILIAYRYHQSTLDAKPFSAQSFIKIEKTLVISGGISAFLMGMSSWLFYENLPQSTVLFLIVLLSLGPAVTAVSFAGRLRLWFSITLGLMVPMISYVFFRWTAQEIVPSGLFSFWLLAYVVYTAFIAYKQHTFIKENLYLKFQLEEAVKSRTQYLAIASHDLRQPMHAMGLFISALQPHVKQAGNRAFGKLNESVLALRTLFDSLLDISRLDADIIEPNLQAIKWQPFIEKIISGFKPAAEQKGLSIQLHSEAFNIHSDPVLLERVLRNLISNAIRFSSKSEADKGEIRIHCQLEDKRVIINIEDQGCGVPANEIEDIFSEYYQLENSERDRSKGLGLGLAIVKRICHLLDVPLKLRSEEGVGSIFSLTLPLFKGQFYSPVAVTPSWDLSERLILVVDDEQAVLEGMRQLLALWGCKTLLAQSAEEMQALLVNAQTPDIIIADYRLRDGKTGAQAIALIRQRFPDHTIPGILITGDTAPERLIEAKESGLWLLHKPIAPAQLRSAIYQATTTFV